jgi:hypothetical protein
VPLSHRPLRRHVAVLVAYAALSLVLTYPLVLRFGSHVPGDGIDDPALAWNLWWVKYALVDQQTNPFSCGWMFHPIGINLAYYTLTVLNGLLSVPLQMVLGLVPASNLLLLSSFVFSAFGAYLLALYLIATITDDAAPEKGRLTSTGRQSCAFLGAVFAGLVYGFSSSKLFYASLGQFNVASSQWIPLAVLYILKAGRDRSLRSSALAGLFFVLQAYAELTFASFLMVFLGLRVLVDLLRSLRKQRRVRDEAGPPCTGRPLPARVLVRNLAVLAVVLFVGIAPILANMLPDMLKEGDFTTSGGGFADVFSADLAGYAVPTQLHPLMGEIAAALPFPHDKGQHLFLGYGVTLLAAWGLWRGRRQPEVRFWGLSALFFLLLTLGPTLRVLGWDSSIPGPFALVERMPFFKANRYPSRYSVMLVLSGAMLACIGLAQIMGRAARRSQSLRRTARRHHTVPAAATTFGIVVLLFVLEHVSIPLPLSDMRVPGVYDRIEADPEDVAVLELPIGWRNGARVLGQQDVIIMFQQWYQTAHRKRLLGGNTSRNPEFTFQYFAQAPLLSSLVAIESGHEVPVETVSADRADAPDVLAFLGVRYVLIHEPPASPALLRYADEVLPLELLEEESGIRLYRVLPTEPAQQRALLADSLGRLHLGEGWSPLNDRVQGEDAVWAQRPEVRVLARLTDEPQRLRFRAWGLPGGQQVEIWAQGCRQATLELSAGWNDYELDLPREAVIEGLNSFRFRFQRTLPIASEALSEVTERTVAGKTFPVSIVAQSAGLDTGGQGLGHVFVNGEDLSLNRRGYNVVALTAAGEVLSSESFDTHLDPQASGRLADAIARLPAGSIIAAAVADEGSMNLSEEAVEALRSVGAAVDLRGSFRWGHALIGVKGASPGEALETAGYLRPVAVHVGIGATEPIIVGALAFVEVRTPPQ